MTLHYQITEKQTLSDPVRFLNDRLRNQTDPDGHTHSLVALTMIFILVRVIPGDPTSAVMGDYVTEKSLEVLKKQMGLDLPLIEQYGSTYNFIRGDFGNSLITGAPVLKELKNALPTPWS